MITYDLLRHLDSCNLLKPLIYSGQMDSCVLTKLDIYQYYDKEIKIGKKKTDAITHTADECGVCERYVYKIITQMQIEIK